MMADVIHLADVYLARFCADNQLQPSEALKLGFRLGFVAGKTQEKAEIIEQYCAQEQQAG